MMTTTAMTTMTGIDDGGGSDGDLRVCVRACLLLIDTICPHAHVHALPDAHAIEREGAAVRPVYTLEICPPNAAEFLRRLCTIAPFHYRVISKPPQPVFLLLLFLHENPPMVRGSWYPLSTRPTLKKPKMLAMTKMPLVFVSPPSEVSDAVHVGLYSYGLRRHGLYSYGLRGHGLCIVMACVGIAYTAMAYVVMAYIEPWPA